MDPSHRGYQVLNVVLAIVLLVAVGITAYAINEARSLQSEAKGKPTTTTSVTPADSSSSCATFLSWEGRVKSGQKVDYTAEFCGDSQADLLVALNWKNATKKLSLTVTDPNGKSTTVEQAGVQNYVAYAQAKPLPTGEWTFTVELTSGSTEKFSLWARFQ